MALLPLQSTGSTLGPEGSIVSEGAKEQISSESRQQPPTGVGFIIPSDDLITPEGSYLVIPMVEGESRISELHVTFSLIESLNISASVSSFKNWLHTLGIERQLGKKKLKE